MKKTIFVLLAAFSFLLIQGCGGGGGSKGEMIDLDQVLNIMQSTLDSLEKNPLAKSEAPAPVEPVEPNLQPNNVAAVSESATNPEYDDLFLSTFEKNINSASLISDPVRITMETGGAVTGYNDTTQNKLFTIEIDSENNRFIATDTQNSYRRESHFSPGGMFMGYMLGSMLGGQRAAGVSPSKFSNMKMNKPGYHKTAAPTSSSSARSKSGSKSYKTGK